MTIESNNQKLNIPEMKGVGISPTSEGITAPKMPDHLLLEKPKTIFEGMTQNDADYYGLRVEYDAANTDGEDGITKKEYDDYQAKKAAEAGTGVAESTPAPIITGTEEPEKAETTTPVAETDGETTEDDGNQLLPKLDRKLLQDVKPIGISIQQTESVAEKLKNYKINIGDHLKPVEITTRSDVMTYSRNLLREGMTIENLFRIQERIEELGESDFRKMQIQDVIDMFAEADEDQDGTLSLKESTDFLTSSSKKITEHVDKALNLTARNSISETSSSGKRTLTNTIYENIDSFGNEISDPDALSRKAEGEGINVIPDDKRKLKSGTYIVQKGDTLADIAKDFNISLIGLCLNNKDVLGDKTTLTPGTALKISGFQTDVKSGERIEFEQEILGIISSDGDINSKVKQFAQTMQAHTEKPKLFVGMTRDQAIDAGVEDLWDLYSCNLGQITQAAFAKYQKSISPIDNTDIMSLVKIAVGNELDLSDFSLFTDTILPLLMDCSGKDGHSDAYKTADRTIQDALKNLDGLTPEQIATKSQELMNSLRNNAKDEIIKKGKTYSGHMERLKNGQFNQFEKMQGLSEGVKLTDEQISYYAQIATKAEYILPIIYAVDKAIKNNDDNQIIALVANLGTEFFNLPDVINVVQAYGLANICDSLKAKLASMIAKNAITEGASDASQALLGAVIASTGNGEALEEYSRKVNESIDNYDDYIAVVQAAISNMPEETQNELKEVLNNARTSAPNETQAPANQGTATSEIRGGSAGESYTSAQNSQDYNGLPVGSYNNSAQNGIEATRSQSHEFMDNRGIASVTADQSSINHAAFRISKEYKEHQQLRYAQARIKNMSKTKIFEIVAKNFDKIPDQYKDEVENYFKQMPTQLLVETMIGNEDIQNFMFRHKFVKFDDLITYVRKHPQLVSSGNKEMSDSLKEKLQEYVKDNKIDDVRVETTT